MSGYQGMRWFRCDLQVQTPEDGRHWDREDPLRLPNPRTEQDLQEKARCYLRRCHEVGLEVIGVTDHNFCGHRKPRERFLAHLIDQNSTVAEELGRDPIWIFPGFEVDIGFHVLCLFPPVKSARLDEICDVLTELGLLPGRRFNDHGSEDLRTDGNYVALSKVLRVVQEKHRGIVIAAHAFEEDGIAGKDGKWAVDYRNEELLCVEVSRVPLGPRELSVLEAPAGVWKRTRPLAWIRSSDAKSTLTDSEGNPRPNSLGYRSTWIKMSEPSIEALRQAFLDPASRIRLEGDPRAVLHDRIHSISIQNVEFLQDQEVFFSPHLNCLIGGRGSGKSSLFEYIRFGLRREDEPEAEKQVERIRKTLKPDSILRLRWRERGGSSATPGPEDVFEYRPLGGRARVIREHEVDDPSTVFRRLDVQIFSQREISDIAAEDRFLLKLIDNLTGPRLRNLVQQETELREHIRGLLGQQQTLERLRQEERALAQEVHELDRQWTARSAVQEEQGRHRAAQEAERYLEEVAGGTRRVVEDLDRWAADLVDAHSPLGSVVKKWPEPDFFETLDEEIERAKQSLTAELREAAARYQARIDQLTTASESWPRVRGAIQQAEEQFREACARQGLRPQDLAQLFQLDQSRKAKSLELNAKRSQAALIEKSAEELAVAWKRLFDIWREQTEARREEIQRILSSEAVPKVPKDPEGRRKEMRPSVELQLTYAADWDHFESEWQDLTPDGRNRLGRQWQEIGNRAFEEFRLSAGGSPWEVVEGWLRDVTLFPSELADLRALLTEHLGRRKDLWDRKRLVRIQDAVDLILYRADGTLAGSLKKKELSDGQTNTALLMLLLASGRGPILIDQPEDELDSSFIFQQLVPILREIKSERQIIVVTHNPNLPVNADAEMVYGLQAESVNGRAHGVVRAQGGLDRPAVKEAVLDIMEGSEEAFRKRGEKYHF